MDSKKANLTPELKEIYDRVMNTSGTPQAAPATPQTPPPVAPNPLDAQPPSSASSTAPNPLNPPTLPNSPIPPTAPLPVTGTPPAPAENPQIPAMPSIPSPAEQALSSTPARPISEGNTFAFNGTAKNAAPAAKAQADPAQKKKIKISMPILIVLGVAFIAVWGVFWAIILGLVQR